MRDYTESSELVYFFMLQGLTVFGKILARKTMSAASSEYKALTKYFRNITVSIAIVPSGVKMGS